MKKRQEHSTNAVTLQMEHTSSQQSRKELLCQCEARAKAEDNFRFLAQTIGWILTLGAEMDSQNKKACFEDRMMTLNLPVTGPSDTQTGRPQVVSVIGLGLGKVGLET